MNRGQRSEVAAKLKSRRRESFVAVVLGPANLVREGLCRILRAAEFRVLPLKSMLECSLLKPLPNRQFILILDVGEDELAAGPEILRFKKHYPAARAVVIAEHYRRDAVAAALRAGANAYLLRETPCDSFIQSLELVMLGETIIPAAMLPSIVGDDLDGEPVMPAETEAELNNGSSIRLLSEREQCVLSHLIAGDSNKAIARKMNISDGTVKVHVKALLRKIRVHNRTQAAIWAMSNSPLLPALNDGSPNQPPDATGVALIPLAGHEAHVPAIPGPRSIGGCAIPQPPRPNSKSD